MDAKERFKKLNKENLRVNFDIFQEIELLKKYNFQNSNKANFEKITRILSPFRKKQEISEILNLFQVPETLRDSVFMYSDDIIICNNNLQNIQEILKGVLKHADENNYNLNPKKCFYNAAKAHEIIIHDTIITKKTLLITPDITLITGVQM
ncbi:hypothetical protein CWI38_0278p0010 [Hamiltosporidium tvaerminnensis]|uniref:Reverse transcriptase domain-containing protein n=1 Tax=Hamiltosporidium tvaerminnensis TaxID=1176355 RepID=A0A4Q9LYR8_9MICR|nr:hypothetical protein CWI38_0278p0010 [Hamiltosporidium tvaerminnensis]